MTLIWYGLGFTFAERRLWKADSPMKQITKGTDPREFADWKSADKMAHRANWNRVNSELKTVIHVCLMREQGFTIKDVLL